MDGMFYADIMESRVLSLESQRYAHVIGNGRGFAKVYPMERKNESIHALDNFVKKVGISETLLYSWWEICESLSKTLGQNFILACHT